MIVGLVSPLTLCPDDFNRSDSSVAADLAKHLPLGILTLASMIRHRGWQARFIDLNYLYWQYSKERLPTTDFCDYSVAFIEQENVDVLGLGSICYSFPLTLRIAERFRSKVEQVPALLGGPQASAVDLAVLQHFSAVDVVVRGEAEESFPALLSKLASDRCANLDDIPGITYRQNGRPVHSRATASLTNLDDLPMPAYDLFPQAEVASILPVELGRGCPYACTFCSTNDFFRRRFRLRSPQITLRHMEFLHERYGVTQFELVHDMFTVNRKKVVEFCEVLADAGNEFRWNCSARTDRVDPELLDLMQQSGCRGIFFGVETGSSRLQKIIKKKLDMEQAEKAVRDVSDRGMTAITSMIIGFAEETPADLRATSDALVRFLLAENSKPQLHLLSPLAGTPIYAAYREKLCMDRIGSDISGHNALVEKDWQLVARHADIFPDFYAVPGVIPRRELMALRNLITIGLQGWRLFLVALNKSEPLPGLACAYADWKSQANPAQPQADETQRLAKFLVTRFDGTKSARVVKACTSIWQTANQALTSNSQSVDRSTTDSSTVANRPRLVAGAALVDIGVDYQQLKLWILGQLGAGQVSACRQTLWIQMLDRDSAAIRQISGLGRDLLAMCDGSRTMDEIATNPAISEKIDTGDEARLAIEMLVDGGYIHAGLI